MCANFGAFRTIRTIGFVFFTMPLDDRGPSHPTHSLKRPITELIVNTVGPFEGRVCSGAVEASLGLS